MREITFDEASEMVSLGYAGFYCAEGVALCAHPIRTVVATQGKFYLATKAEISLEDLGLAGNAEAWTRAIVVKINPDSPLKTMLENDRAERRRLKLPLSSDRTRRGFAR